MSQNYTTFPYDFLEKHPLNTFVGDHEATMVLIRNMVLKDTDLIIETERYEASMTLVVQTDRHQTCIWVVYWVNLG